MGEQAPSRALLDALEVFVTSPKRRMVSTGEFSGSLRAAVEARGGIVADRQYDLERVGRH